jgi:hypothetical protein
MEGDWVVYEGSRIILVATAREVLEGETEPSLALQYGAPLDVLRKALLRDSHGRPSTPIGCALDLLARQP